MAVDAQHRNLHRRTRIFIIDYTDQREVLGDGRIPRPNIQYNAVVITLAIVAYHQDCSGIYRSANVSLILSFPSAQLVHFEGLSPTSKDAQTPFQTRENAVSSGVFNQLYELVLERPNILHFF